MRQWGYRNNSADLERFPLVRRMWELVSTNTYAVAQIRRFANEEWGFRTYQTRRTGGAQDAYALEAVLTFTQK